MVQRVIEAAGISTISISPIPAFTASVGAPRVVGISHPMGRTMGPPGDAEKQGAVLKATLAALQTMKTPGQVVDLPYEWPQSLREAKKFRAPLPPIAKLIIKKPWMLMKFISGEIPD